MPTTFDMEPIPPSFLLTDRQTVADLLNRLGNIAPERIHLHPAPGTATLADLIAWNERRSPTCEWIDGTLVEKVVGAFESWLGIIIQGQFDRYLEQNDLGMLYGEAAVLRMLPNLGRAADVAFVRWIDLPGGMPPPREDPIPEVVPALVVEVLSITNTKAEMTRKRSEYFRAGVELVWEIDPPSRSAKVYTAPNAFEQVPTNGTLDGRDVLPGFTLSLQAIFDRAERARRR